MSNYFNCKLCDKSIKYKSKKKHLNSQYDKSLSMSIISRYIITTPDFLQIEMILKKYALDFNKKFDCYLIICKWKLHFSSTFIDVKTSEWCCISDDYYLRDFISSKIKNYEKRGHEFSHISEMNLTFLAHPWNITYEYYLTQSKSMLEWKLNALLAKNPKPIEKFGNISHPLFRKSQHTNEDDGEN